MSDNRKENSLAHSHTPLLKKTADFLHFLHFCPAVQTALMRAVFFLCYNISVNLNPFRRVGIVGEKEPSDRLFFHGIKNGRNFQKWHVCKWYLMAFFSSKWYHVTTYDKYS